MQSDLATGRALDGVVRAIRPAGLAGAQGGGDAAPANSGLDLAAGTVTLDTPDFTVKLVKSSQTIAALEPKGVEPYTPESRGRGRGRGRRGGGADATPTPAPTPVPFDFTPADQLGVRSEDGYYHLGDLSLRLRTGDSGQWQNFSTAMHRAPVKALPPSEGVLAAADLAPTLPDNCPVDVVRRWGLDDGKLTMTFELKNKGTEPVEIGSLGMAMVFNNMIFDFTSRRARSLDDAHAICSFVDPAINMDGGYLQVTRLSGHGPALLVVEEGKSPLEAYNPLNNPGRNIVLNPMPDRTQIQQTFEGTYEWLVHSKAYAENEWKGVRQWNPPTSELLAPGATRTFGVKFLLSPGIRQIDKTLQANNRPVAVGIPGYVAPMDQDLRLFLKYASPVKSITVDPEGAISVKKDADSPGGDRAYTLRGQKWGRARLSVTYDNDKVQTIRSYVIKPEKEVVNDMGHFLFTKAWFTDMSDPFHRAPSVMNYDREHNKIVEQSERSWVAGLEDEAGSGGWVAAAMKEFGQPKPEEVAKFEKFIDGVLWGGIQYSNADNPDHPMWGVRKSMFYYGLDGYKYDVPRNPNDWQQWVEDPSVPLSDVKRADAINRAYNYPHVVAAYWAMYRLARYNPGLVTNHPWQWYLDHAFNTIKFMGSNRGVGYVDTGLMEGDVFLKVLEDMKLEGGDWTPKANEIQELMKRRADVWAERQYPFGSEMAWDSTGQEEVYAWTRYFNMPAKADVTISAILGYDPTVPNWGYNGNARRYWDMIYGAAPGGHIERQIHHYGSGMNAIPLLTQYRSTPDDFHLLRVGYGGTMGALTNIDQEGFPSAAFHSNPSSLRWDSYIGDYGPNFFGHALNTATYVVDNPEYGWVAFGGNLKQDGDWVNVDCLDSFRKRVYVASRGLYLTLDAGEFKSVSVNTKTHAVRIALAPADPHAPNAYLNVEQPAKLDGVGTYKPAGDYKMVREAYEIPLKSDALTVELSD